MFEYEELERVNLQSNNSALPNVPGLETYKQFATRVEVVISDILKKASRDSTTIPLIVGHGGFFRFLCSVLRLEVIKQIGNCEPVLLKCTLESDTQNIIANGNWSLEKLSA